MKKVKKQSETLTVKSAVLKDTKVVVENGVVTVHQVGEEAVSQTIPAQQSVVIENGVITIQAPEDLPAKPKAKTKKKSK